MKPTRAGSRPELLDRPSPTVTTCEVKGTRGEGQHGGPDRASDAAWLGAGIRRLTTAECAKLMAFPDDHPWCGTKTSIYAQIGNGCTPPVVEALARAVAKAAGGEWPALGLWMVGEGPRPAIPAPVAGVETREPPCPCLGRWAGPVGSWWLVGRPVRGCAAHGVSRS